MYKKLDDSAGGALGVEISQGYTQADMEAFRKDFEAILAQGHDKVNFVVKIDEMSILKSDFKALWHDSIYSLKHLDQFRHIAIVGDSATLKVLTELDNMVLGSKKKERIEKYFDISELDKAWEFARS